MMIQSLNQLMMAVFVEQPLALPGSANKYMFVLGMVILQAKQYFIILCFCFLCLPAMLSELGW